MNATASFSHTDAPERIARLIYVLCQTVTMRCSVQVRTLTQEQVKYICERLWASRKRFLGVVARVRAGKPPKVRARKPRVRKVRPKRLLLRDLVREFAASLPRGWQRRAREDRARARAAAKAAREAAAAAKPLPLWRALRQHRRAWLCPLVGQIPGLRDSAPGVAIHVGQILAEPEMQALLLSHPYIGEALRDVCHALGVEQTLLHLRPWEVAAPATAEPGPEPEHMAASAGAGVSPPAAAPSMAGKIPVSRPAPMRHAADVSRAAPRTGVVIIDYWAPS